MRAEDLDWVRLRKYAIAILRKRRLPFDAWEDVAMDAVVHVLDNLDKFNPTRGEFYTWAYRVLDRYVAGEKKRWWKEQQNLKELYERRGESPELAAIIEHHWLQLQLMLRSSERRVAEAIMQHGNLPRAELAKLAGIKTAKSVRVHIWRINKCIAALKMHRRKPEI